MKKKLVEMCIRDSIKSGGMLNYMIGILISLVVGFAVTMALSKHSKFKEV